MKWLIVIIVLVSPAIAFSKSYDVSLDNTPVLSENMLEQQRGGFSVPGANYSIGLKLEVLVNGSRVFFSNLLNVDRHSHFPALISNILGADGLRIKPLLGNGQIGYIVENAGNGIRTDVKLHINVTSPVNIDAYKESQRVATRVRDAVRHVKY